MCDEQAANWPWTFLQWIKYALNWPPQWCLWKPLDKMIPMTRKCHWVNNSYLPSTVRRVPKHSALMVHTFKCMNDAATWCKSVNEDIHIKWNTNNLNAAHFNLLIQFSVCSARIRIKSILTKCTQRLCHGCCHNNVKKTRHSSNVKTLCEFDLILMPWNPHKPLFTLCSYDTNNFHLIVHAREKRSDKRVRRVFHLALVCVWLFQRIGSIK